LVSFFSKSSVTNGNKNATNGEKKKVNIVNTLIKLLKYPAAVDHKKKILIC